MRNIEFSRICSEDIDAVVDGVGCGIPLAYELLIIAGGDVELAIEAAKEGGRLSLTKAKIIDARFNRIEQKSGVDNCSCHDQGQRDLSCGNF